MHEQARSESRGQQTSHVAVIVLMYNGLDDTRRCLESLSVQTHSHLSTIVVDNQSAEDPEPILRRDFPWCHVLRNSANLGFAGGNNRGIELALTMGAQGVLVLNNDTVADPRLVERLLAAARSQPEFGIVGPVIKYMDVDEVMTDGCLFNTPDYNGFFRRLPVQLESPDRAGIVDVDIVNGCCMMIAAAVFHRIGLFDERFFLIHEETDLCLRARQCGFPCGILGEALVRHKGSSTFKKGPNGLQRYYDSRNLFLLLRKHSRTHRNGRSALGSWIQYVRHVYYVYAVAREHGHDAVARCALEGLVDALRNRYGGCRPRRRREIGLVQPMFRLWHTWRRLAGA